MENTVIDFSQYSAEELDLLIQGLGSIDLDFRDELGLAFTSVQAKGLNKEMLKEEIDALVNEEVGKAKARLEDKSERIQILKAKLIALKRARASNQPEQPVRSAPRAEAEV